MKILAKTLALAATVLGIAVGAGCATVQGEETQARSFNYAEAMQKSLYFFEAQQSGRLSPNNRAAWRGPACLTDGREIGKDLSGGWFDAGDHWTANLTMAWSALCLATSADRNADAWIKTGQMDELLESLIHVNSYFVRCVLNPEATDPADLEVCIGCGGRNGVGDRNVHAEWASAEVAHLLTERPAFVVNKKVPAGDVPAAMSAAMATSALVIRQYGAVLKGKKGYDTFDPNVFSDLLIARAEKLLDFAALHMSPAENDGRAIRMTDGLTVKTEYRSDLVPDKVFTAAAVLARYHRLGKNDAAAKTRQQQALDVYQGPYVKASLNDWWHDNFLAFFGKLGAIHYLQLDPTFEPAHNELTYYACRFLEYFTTPAGLRLREKESHQWGSLRHANNVAMIALLYRDLIEQSPPLTGNTWWLQGRTKKELRDAWLREGRRQVDYALGDNPYGRSYLVGFGNRPFNNPHHRGAYGAWAGFEHLINRNPEYRPETCRHILYGALLGGPDNQDVFTCLRAEDNYVFRHPDNPLWGIMKPSRAYQFQKTDEPIQIVSNAQYNEVAIDYNAAFTANLAYLQAQGLGVGKPIPDDQFPPVEERNANTDLLTTDREFFASARLLKTDATGSAIELTVWNRSRWPARVTDHLSVRLDFTPEQAAALTPKPTGNPKAVLDETHRKNARNPYIIVAFPNVPIFPGQRYEREDDFERVVLHFSLPPDKLTGGWLPDGIRTTERMLEHVPVFQGSERIGGDPSP